MAKSKKEKLKVTLVPIHRNVIAQAANTRSWGSGHHGDKKKEARKKACRKKVEW